MDGSSFAPSPVSRAAPDRPALDSPATLRLAVCPVCQGPLIEIRAKLQCGRCHRICETCCEGGRG